MQKINQMLHDQVSAIAYHNTINPMTEIIKKDNGTITVNGKECYQDQNGNWIAREELTAAETKAFANFTSIEANTGARVQKATYT